MLSPDRTRELRTLVDAANDSESDEDRDAALRKLAEFGQRGFTFPGRRTRGDAPAGVALR
jgi:hypothetical protein